VSENRVLKGIYGLQTDKAIGGRRKLYNEELHNLYSPPNIGILKSKRRK
jgi:hypothetical protein